MTAPIDRPHRPIHDICLLLLRYETTTLRSSLCHRGKEGIQKMREAKLHKDLIEKGRTSCQPRLT